MKRLSTCALIPASLLLALSFIGAQETGLARGAELLRPFKRDLMQALQAGIAGGPVAAIEVCQVQAPEIAAALSRDGVRVGRTSDRLRNPANASPDWVKPILDAYLASEEDRSPRAVSLADDRTGYVEPILTQPMCVICHGEGLSRDVAARIDELYPDDRAIGFEVGDLRGVFWTEFPTPP